MRHYQNFELPRGLRTHLLTKLAQSDKWVPADKAEWRQALLSDVFEQDEARSLRDQLVARVSKAVGQNFKPRDFSGVLHWGSAAEVPRHADNLAKTSFLVPLRCPPSLEFSEGYARCTLYGKKLVRFNDYERHGLDNPHLGHFFLLTLSRDMA